MPDFSEITLPPQCEGCGVQCEAASRLMSLLISKQLAQQAGETLVGEDGERVDEMIDEAVPPEVANDVKHQLRMMVGKDMETIDQEIDSEQAGINANALACSGVLKMRASKGDVTYTANICTSPRVYSRDSVQPEHLPVHIRASSRPNIS